MAEGPIDSNASQRNLNQNIESDRKTKEEISSKKEDDALDGADTERVEDI